MSSRPYPSCPRCGADNVLPFEEEEKTDSDPTLFVIIVLAFGLLMGYFLFIISSYLIFPLVVFVAIIIATRLINRQEKKKKVEKHPVKDYMCLDCGGFFRK